MSGGLQERLEEVRLPGEMTLDLPAGMLWRARLEADGFWSAERVLVVEETGTSVTLTAHVAGRVTARLQPEVGHTLPKDVSVRFRSAGDRDELPEGFPEGEVRCDVEDGGLACALPAGGLDLRLRAQGFVSHYLWNAQVPPGGALALGSRRLLAGASVVGWIEASNHPGFRFDKVAVELAPQVAGAAPSLRDDQRRASLSLDAPVNPRGFFSFSGVQAGSYRLIVHHPGLAPARLAPVVVLDGAETEIHPLFLRPPVTLDVVLQPATDPFLQPWSLRLFEKSPMPGHRDEVAAGRAVEGTWRDGSLEPGCYVLQVSDSRGSRWYAEELEILGDTRHEVELDIMRVAGTLLLGDEPLVADIWFGGFHGARRIGVRSNEEGRFYVFLPRRKSWPRVEVIDEPLGLRRMLREVHIPEKARGASWPEIELRLADTAVEGEVVDTDGKPVPQARVEALSEQEQDHVQVRVIDGRFRFRALAPGPWRLQATAQQESQSLRSESLAVEVGPDRDPGALRLTLRAEVELSGIVLDGRQQPVPGARVVVQPEQVGTFLTATVPEQHTDVQGGFRLHLPEAVQRAVVTVFPPGHAVTRRIVALPSDQPLMIQVEPVGGELSLVAPPAEGESPSWQRIFRTALFQDGARLGHPFAWKHWAEINGKVPRPDHLVLPRLAPGAYTLCLESSYLAGRVLLPPGVLPNCVYGELPPYGALQLEVPGQDVSFQEVAEGF